MKIIFLLLCLVWLVISKQHTGRKRVKPEQRVIGGNDASLSDWSFTVHLNFHKAEPLWKICGGTLIATNMVLTVAHCIEDIHDQPKMVTVGVNRLKPTSTAGHGKNFTVSKILVHPSFVLPSQRVPPSNYSLDYDIAILKLSQSVGGTNNTAVLPSLDEELSTDAKCKVAGYGAASEFENKKDFEKQIYDIPDNLKEAELPVIAKSTCIADDDLKNHFVWGDKLDRILCAGEKGKQRATTCIGDSGSPFICKNDENENVLHGLTLGGPVMCKSSDGHVFFTQVSRYRLWIDRTLSAENNLTRY